MRAIGFFVGFVAVTVAIFPATVIIRRGWDEHSGYTPVFVAAGVAAVGFLVCRQLRAVASRRFVAVSLERGHYQPYRSPAFVYTLVAWVPVLVVIAMAAATFNVDKRAEGPVDEDPFRDPVYENYLPALVLLAAVFLVGAVSYYSWDFRRRHEIPTLAAAGVVSFVEPPRKLPKKAAVKLRTTMWIRATVIDGLFLAGAMLPRLLPGGERPTEDEAMRGVVMLVGGPGAISFTLLIIMLILWPTRRSAFDAVRQPSSLVAIGLVGAGLAVDAGGAEGVGNLVGIAGLVLASVTCLHIMDSGAQPWLGLAFLPASYSFGYLSAPDGHIGLPTGIAGWTVAVLAAAYAAHQARSHWRTWHGLIPGRTAATPPAWP